jgi:general secretion pathway protein C
MSTVAAIAVAVMAQLAGASAHLTPREVARGIKCGAPGNCVIRRALVDRMLADTETLAAAARIEPSSTDGKSDGFTFSAVRPRSWLDRLGVRDGDTLTAVNGYELTSPAAALIAYTQLRNATHFAVRIVRHGEPLTLTYEIR